MKKITPLLVLLAGLLCVSAAIKISEFQEKTTIADTNWFELAVPGDASGTGSWKIAYGTLRSNIASTVTSSSGPTTNAPPQTLAITSGLGSTNILIDFLALAATNTVRATLTGNVGVMLTNIVDGKDVTLELLQDSTGNRTAVVNATWGFNTRFGIDITGFALSTNGGYRDLIKFHGAGTNGQVSGNLRGFAP